MKRIHPQNTSATGSGRILVIKDEDLEVKVCELGTDRPLALIRKRDPDGEWRSITTYGRFTTVAGNDTIDRPLPRLDQKELDWWENQYQRQSTPDEDFIAFYYRFSKESLIEISERLESEYPDHSACPPGELERWERWKNWHEDALRLCRSRVR